MCIRDRYDSSQGKYEHADEVSASDDSITVCGKEIKIYAFPDANNCPWGELKVDVVLECSGFYTSKEKAQAHINAGARKVVISAPAGNDLPTIVYNTNHETLKATDTIISAASCTTNCLAPMADALNKFAPIPVSYTHLFGKRCRVKSIRKQSHDCDGKTFQPHQWFACSS